MNDLTSLSERVEGAGGPDRELDAALACAVDPGRAGYWPNPVIPDGALVNDNGIMCRAEAYTASLDSALGLVDRVLPGAGLLIGRHQTPETRPWARIGPWNAPDATGATLPLAVLAALLKALAASGERGTARGQEIQPASEGVEP
jgi:hypothetical protein